MNPYLTFEEWLKDYKIFRENTNDNQLLNNIAVRLEGTSKELKNKITDYIESDALLVNPMQVIKNLYNRTENTFVVVNSEKDIWFSV